MDVTTTFGPWGIGVYRIHPNAKGFFHPISYLFVLLITNCQFSKQNESIEIESI